MARILVSGGAGYKGSVLIPALIARNHYVTAVDPCWFGNYLPNDPNLILINSSVADFCAKDIVMDFDIAIILHSVANDPCSDLDPQLTWDTACHETAILLRRLSYTSCRKVIFASSASVYGIRSELDITEDLDPVPVSVYNKTKVIAERIVLSYPVFNPTILRPATVCGLSPRMRLDTVVNMLSMQALCKKEITVLGGSQYRPNVHIKDLTEAYLFFIDNLHLCGIYNVGNDTRSVSKIAQAVRSHIPCDIVVKSSNDPRSYRLSTNKLIHAGFTYKYNILSAIKEIADSYNSGNLHDFNQWYNIRWMRDVVLK